MLRISGLGAVALTAVLAGSASADVVIDETFTGEPGGGWMDNFGNVPTNVGNAGTWMNSGHVPGGVPDNDWRPLVQNEVGAAGTLPGGDYMATKNRTGNQTGVVGVFNMDGIIQFSLANGTARPAATGEKIVGQFSYYAQDGNFGFGFTDNIASLQAYQAAIPVWNGVGSSPVNMPTAYTDLQNGSQVGISSNITGHIAMNGGAGALYTHAVVDLDGGGDGFVDQGNIAPKTDPVITTNRPLGPAAGARQIIRFEYTVGNSTYDLLQVDQNGDGAGFVDILQSPDGNITPNPGGPMPVGAILNSIEGMFITGGNGQLTEVWYDDIHVEIIPEPASMSLLGLAAAGLLRFRRR